MRFLRIILYTIVAIVGMTVLVGGGTFLYLIKTLPSVHSLAEYSPSLTTKVYAVDGEMIGEFFIERRTVVGLEHVPRHMIDAFLAAEDAKFYQHEGLDYAGILRAFYKNLQAGRVVQGGSTITQQVAKGFFLTPERTIQRKIREAFMAHRIEKLLTKDEILHLYLNQIYFGSGAYGVQAASETYFGKDVSEMTLGEAALLAALPKAPSRYSPYVNPKGAKRRQKFVLQRMIEEGYVSRELAEYAIYSELKYKPRTTETLWTGPYFTEHIRRYLEENYGHDLLYKGGLLIYTTMDIKLQKAANEAVKKGIRYHDRRRGFRGPIATLASDEEAAAFVEETAKELGGAPPKMGRFYRALITRVGPRGVTFDAVLGDYKGRLRAKDMKWARIYNPTKEPDGGTTVDLTEILLPGSVVEVELREAPPVPEPVEEELTEEEDYYTDTIIDTELSPPPVVLPLLKLRLVQQARTQAALFAMETDTGYVRAMVGGSDFKKTEFNRAIQARRQPGSAFKPIIYASALDKGYTPATIVVDSPIVFEEVIEKEEELEGEEGVEGEEILTEEELKAAAEEAAIEEALTESQEGMEGEEGLEGEDEEEEELVMTWKPRNFEEKFHGPTTIREALTKSRNVVTIKVLRDVGVGHSIKYARKLGVTAPLARDLSLALGSSSVTLSEMVGVFATFDNLGKRVEPIFITKITDNEGRTLEENRPTSTQAISPQTAYIMTSLLRGVVEHGTGWRARALKRPSAGKTGTTNNLNDAWYMGYIPGFATGVWIGYDQEWPLGKNETGSKAAAPIWVRFMKEKIKDTPIEDFKMPDGVEFARIDPKTGLLASPTTENALFEVFKVGTKPTETARPTSTTRTKDFFILDAGDEKPEEEETPEEEAEDTIGW